LHIKLGASSYKPDSKSWNNVHRW